MARLCPRCKKTLTTRKVKESSLKDKPYDWPPKRDDAYQMYCSNCGYIPRKQLKKERKQRRKRYKSR